MHDIEGGAGPAARHARYFHPVIFTVLALALTLAPPSSQAREWEWRDPLPQGNPVRCMAADAEQVVAVADHGTVLRSADGRTWAVALERFDVPFECRALATGDGRWLLSLAEENWWGYHLLVSADAGRTWTRAGAAPLLRDIVWHEGRFLGVGVHADAFEGPARVSHIVESVTGEQWSELAQVDHPLAGIAAGASRYVAVGVGGGIVVSDDKQAWSQAATPTTAALHSVAYASGRFVVVGAGGTMLASEDGLSWRTVTSGTDSTLRRIVGGDDGFAAIGEGGALLTSDDGLSWRAQRSDSGATLRAVAALGSGYVAGGDGGELHTHDEGDWQARSAAAGGGRARLNDLVAGAGGLLAVGDAGRLLRSVDGQAWEAVAGDTDADLKGAVYGGGQFVVVGEGGVVLRSPDGRAWTRHGAGGALNDVAWGHGRYVAVGDGGFITHSANGQAWSVTTIGNPGAEIDLIRVLAGEGGWVALGRGGQVLHSPEGEAWEPRALLEGYTYTDLLHDGERFLVVGTDWGASSLIYQSADGRLWDEAADLGEHVLALVPDDEPGHYLAAGTDGFEGHNVWLQLDGLRDYRTSGGVTRVHRLIRTGGAVFALGEDGALLQSGVFASGGGGSGGDAGGDDGAGNGEGSGNDDGAGGDDGQGADGDSNGGASSPSRTGGGGCALGAGDGVPDPLLLLLLGLALVRGPTGARPRPGAP